MQWGLLAQELLQVFSEGFPAMGIKACTMAINLGGNNRARRAGTQTSRQLGRGGGLYSGKRIGL